MQIENFSEKMSQFKSELKMFAEYIKDMRATDKKVQREFWQPVCGSSRRYDAYLPVSKTIYAEFKARWEGKFDYKSVLHGSVYGKTASWYYRHMHVAYSLLRGRTMEEIEPKVDENNQLELSLVEHYVEKYMGIKEFFKQIMEFRRNKPKVIKLYVLVREDMPPIHRAVQGGHAVAEYLMNHVPVLSNGKNAVRWKNGYMIYLAVKDEQELSHWEAKLQAAGKSFSTFVEPDWGDPTKTALACVDFGEIFADLPLLNLEVMPQEEQRPVASSLPCP